MKHVEILPDHAGIKQLWLVADAPDGATAWTRQITCCQHDVLRYQWITPISEDAPGLVSFRTADPAPEKARLWRGRAAVHPHAPASLASKVVMIVALGQSNSVGGGSTVGPTSGPVTVVPPPPNTTNPRGDWPWRLLTWAPGGTLPHQVGVGKPFRTIALDVGQVAGFGPLVEGSGTTVDARTRETFCSALGRQLNGPAGYDGSAYVHVASYGFGSCRFRDLILKSGVRQQPWLNAMIAVSRAKVLADAAGLPLEAHVVYDGNESDFSAGVAAYATWMARFAALLAEDIPAITGQAVAPHLFLVQPARNANGLSAPGNAALAHVLAAQANPLVHVLPATYQMEYSSDRVHRASTGHQWAGALFGEFIADILMGRGNPALFVTAASWKGARITATWTHPVIIDLSGVNRTTDAGLGVSHINENGATLPVSHLSAKGATTVLHLDSAVPWGAREILCIGFNAEGDPAAGFETGPRTHLRRPDWLRYSVIDGRPLCSFALFQTIPVTRA